MQLLGQYNNINSKDILSLFNVIDISISEHRLIELSIFLKLFIIGTKSIKIKMFLPLYNILTKWKLLATFVDAGNPFCHFNLNFIVKRSIKKYKKYTQLLGQYKHINQKKKRYIVPFYC